MCLGHGMCLGPTISCWRREAEILPSVLRLGSGRRRGGRSLLAAAMGHFSLLSHLGTGALETVQVHLGLPGTLIISQSTWVTAVQAVATHLLHGGLALPGLAIEPCHGSQAALREELTPIGIHAALLVPLSVEILLCFLHRLHPALSPRCAGLPLHGKDRPLIQVTELFQGIYQPFPVMWNVANPRISMKSQHLEIWQLLPELHDAI
mmetsp:Transcript_25/g.87  ORF Transcript_25/g.87 Transcript_25/m.87 type:complete len:207 (-) Transcript_25:578-1198(-)